MLKLLIAPLALPLFFLLPLNDSAIDAVAADGCASECCVDCPPECSDCCADCPPECCDWSCGSVSEGASEGASGTADESAGEAAPANCCGLADCSAEPCGSDA